MYEDNTLAPTFARGVNGLNKLAKDHKNHTQFQKRIFKISSSFGATP